VFPGESQQIAEIGRRTLGQQPEAAANVHQEGIGDLLQLVTQREATHTQLRDHELEFRARLAKREALRTREERALADVAVEADATAEVER
jgi:hypothetical protein